VPNLVSFAVGLDTVRTIGGRSATLSHLGIIDRHIPSSA